MTDNAQNKLLDALAESSSGPNPSDLRILERCREIFLSLKDEEFARVIEASGTLDEITARVVEAVSGCLK